MKMSKKGIIKTQYGDGIENYQKRIKETIVKSLNTHPRTALIRLDLRFPGEDMFYRDDPAVITRFFKSLNERIPVYLKNKRKSGVRAHNTTLRYVWVREFGKQGKHYHIALLVNKDTIHYMNAFQTDKGNFYTMIADSWLSALEINNIRKRCLVHLPLNCTYYLYKKDLINGDIDKVYESIKSRMDYLIKVTQKKSDGERNFGCSVK
ncbi:inovirus Gp2 family protein [Klebsiella pneumoniae]|nr:MULTISPECIES: inovirus Gp2 family protein [Enterobacteriaceae]ELV3662631.1 inovirus Gp2 family protein [Raoultella ornithinolytica]MBC4190557.1 inovirus Gp2 family protein [Klebsiella pneumoniae]MBC4215992.1 inovirus Gp2 family protein [Klebsiella pneumoniae]MBC4325606.1 inovirus Gp2 family protein [Klebsiella pneumoniae]MCP6549890.1 inovirus Gp2 family protein [Klebsiella pneumoniae]